MQGSVWLDGELVAAVDARRSVFDHGFTVGDGIFEALKVVDGRPFAVRRHLARLHRSADAMGFRVPVDDDTLRRAMAEVAASVELPLARVRLTVTSGAAPLGSERGEEPPSVVIAAGPLKPPEPTTAVWVAPWTRNERGALTGVKSTSYGENVRALAAARERGATEALFPNTSGMLCEGTGSNVFVGIGGRLLTPPLTAGCLAGVTRELLLEVTDVDEEDIPMELFEAADEVFLASTGRDVQPVHQVDHRELPAIGPLTQTAQQAFRELAATDEDP